MVTIAADKVTVVIDGRTIISEVSLECPAGMITALVGPSGSGKTTLLHCLGLLQTPTSGHVLVDGQDTSGWRPRRRRRFWRDHSSFVLQDYGIMEDETAAFNVTMASSIIGSRVVGDDQRLQAALARTGLSGRDVELASHLSGGEKQRLAIARAIYKDARVLFVDEPTASLDSANRARVIDLFTSLARRGCVVIVATHDAEMMSACDTQHLIGQSCQDGADSETEQQPDPTPASVSSGHH